MEKLDEVLAKLADKMGELATPAADLLLATARVEALSGLVTGLILAIIASLVIGKIVIPLYKKGREVHIVEAAKDEKGEYRYGRPESYVGWYITAGGFGSVAATLGGVALVGLLNVYNWIGLFYPEIFIARQILKSLGV